MKRILVLSYYFSPDLSAGSFRNTSLVKELSSQIGNRGIIHVITTQPNRYNSFKDKAPQHEEYGNVIIDRIEVPAHRNRFQDQIISYFMFYTKTIKLLYGRKYDMVYASSSKLFTAYLGKRVATRRKIPLYLDIRDIFVETMVDILRKKRFLKPFILKFVEQFVEKPTFKNASHINLVSEGFKEYFSPFTKPRYSFYSNGIDQEFLNMKQKIGLPDWPKIITYAGNIGEGQGLEKIIPDVARIVGDRYVFQVIGDGGTRVLLERKVNEYGLKNVSIINPVKRDALIETYCNSHYLFLHLNNYKAFERVLPSKVFEYGSFNLPVIAGVPGYSRQFIQNNIPNSFVFDPCDSVAMAHWLQSHEYQLEDRTEFIEKFNRENINRKLAASILSYAFAPADKPYLKPQLAE